MKKMNEILEVASKGNEEAKGNKINVVVNDALVEGFDVRERKVWHAPIYMKDYISNKRLSDREIDLIMALITSTNPIIYKKVVMSLNGDW